MRRSLSVAILLGVASGSLAAASDPLPVIGGNPVRGRETFIERGCLACHAVRGTGGRVGPDLAATLVGKGTLAISAAMLNHFPQMLAAGDGAHGPPLPTLDPTDLDDVIAYLFAINFADEPGSAIRGRRVFNEAGCAACHGPGAAGARDAPPLGRGSIEASAIAIAQNMWNPGARMWREAQASGIPLRRFESGEFTDLLAFLGARTAPLRSGEPALPGDPEVGRAVLEAKGCSQCHIRGDARVDVERDLGTGPWYQGPNEIAAAMWNHGPKMWRRMEERGIPAAPLTGNDMADIISFLYVLRSASGAGDPVRGADVFEQKHCIRCHGAGGSAPTLARRTDLSTPIHFAAVMWNHAPRMNELLVKDGLAWPTFSEADVRDVVEYLRSAQPEGTESR